MIRAVARSAQAVAARTAHAHGAAELAAWADHARASLRAAGHRSGGARAAVLDLLSRQECCRSAQEIFDALRGEERAAGIASIYRALDLMTRMGLLRRVDLGPAAYYEPALPGGEHHHHVVCERCGKVAAFSDEALEGAITRLARRLKFTVAEHDVVLRGSCPDCRRAA